MHKSILLAILTLFSFTACSFNSLHQKVVLPSQNINEYMYNFKAPSSSLPLTLYQHHFKPWEQEKITLSYEEATWGNDYISHNMYGMNYQKITSHWFEEQLNNANFEQFAALNQKAITIKNSQIRVFPTVLPLFYNPQKVAEGFPFDYNQNSGIKINTPIMISHLSKDKAWAFVQSSFANGFIPTSDLAYVDNTIIKTFYQSHYYVAIKDNVAVYKNGIFKETIKLGTILPKSPLGKFFVVNQHHNLQGYVQTIDVPQEALALNALTFNAYNVQHIINELIHEPYGWGESFFKRDCSALTRDYFAAFGVFLNRNSSQQIKNGNLISLKELDEKIKKAKIVQEGIPFRTLLYLKGHIMLYVGVSQQNEPLVFHNMWGIKTTNWLNNEERVILGKALISTLEVGKELTGFDKNRSLLNKVEAMVIVE